MMGAFFYSILLQWKLDLRDKNVLVTYYLIPLLFFIFMGGVFTSIMPDSKETIIQSMSVFGITMGAIMGLPNPLSTFYFGGVKRAYQVGNIPLWTAVACHWISAFLHLMVMSLVIYATAPLIFHAKTPAQPGFFFLFLSLFTMVSLGVGVLFGLFVKNTSRLPLVGQLVFLPSVVISGIMFPSGMLPGWLQQAGKVLPATHGYALLCSQSPALSNWLVLLLALAVILVIVTLRVQKLKKI